MRVESLVEYQLLWIEAFNRGDVAATNGVFAPDCVLPITGMAEPLRNFDSPDALRVHNWFLDLRAHL